jgi:hypothetical protein
MSDSLEPKLTRKELKEQRKVIFTGDDGRDYQADLPGSWSNAKVAATNVEKVCHECRDSPHFDPDGYDMNRELCRRIQQAFDELKPGKGFVLAWRLYAEKEHPRWKVADGCGCGCSCGADEGSQEPNAKRAKAKPGAKAGNGKPTAKRAKARSVHK